MALQSYERFSRVAGHALRAALAASAVSLLAACGGGSDGNTTSTGVKFQVVSFGDSLSDVGTYALKASQLGGGRFTTNPGQVWTQIVAKDYGGSLEAAYTGGFGFPLTANPTGFGYAQGGARVTDPVGPGFAADGSGATTVPVVTQVQNYLAAHGSFNAGQIVLITAGANDILVNAEAVGAGAETPTAAGTAVGTAAAQLAGVVGNLARAGAQHIVVSTVPDIGKTPGGLASADGGVALTTLSQVFNQTLTASLKQAVPSGVSVVIADMNGFFTNILGNLAANGFTVGNTGTACNLQRLAAVGGSALFCSPDTYTVPNADQTYMFADLVHPTTHLHALFAAYVETQVAAAGK